MWRNTNGLVRLPLVDFLYILPLEKISDWRTLNVYFPAEGGKC